MTLRIFRTIDDLSAAVGDMLGPTDWMTIDQRRVDRFADATGDCQWIHVDPGRAADGPYGATIAHGYLTLSLIPWFASQLIRLEIGEARLNYGVDRVRFPAPAKVGGRLRASCRVLAVKPHSSGHLLTLSYTIELEDGSKPACVAQTLTLLPLANG